MKVYIWRDPSRMPETVEGSRKTCEDWLFDYGFHQCEVRKIISAIDKDTVYLSDGIDAQCISRPGSRIVG